MGHKYDPDYAVHPGETVKECMAMYGVTPIDIAQNFGNDKTDRRVTEKLCDEIMEICCGYRDIEQKHALAFSLSFSTSVQFWMNRQKYYDQLRLILATPSTRLPKDNLPTDTNPG